MNESLSEAPEKQASPFSETCLPPPDDDPVADAESRRIAEIIERNFQKGDAKKTDHDYYVFSPEQFGLTWEEFLDPRVLARLRPETLCSIRKLECICRNIPHWILDRVVHFRGPCPDWVRALAFRRPRLLPVVLDKVRDDDGIRRVLTALSRKLPGGMPWTLMEDVRSNAYGRFAIHATMCGFHWSPGGVAEMVENLKSPKFFADLLERDEEFIRRFPPEKLLSLLLRIGRREFHIASDFPIKVLPLIEQLETLHPGTIRTCGETLGWGNLLLLTSRSEEAEFMIRHGADPDALDFTGITYRMRRYCDDWYEAWNASQETGEKLPSFRPPETRTIQIGVPPPFSPEILHPFTRLVLVDGRPAAIAAELRAHRAKLAEYLREAKFRGMLWSPRVLCEVGPEFARELLFPYGPLGNARGKRRVFEYLGENAQIWAKRLEDPAISEFVRTYRWLVQRLGRRTFPTCEGSRQGARFPPREGQCKSDVERLRQAVAWGLPDEAAAMAEKFAKSFPAVAWAELGTAPGAGLLWTALAPRLDDLFQKASAKPGDEAFDNKGAVGRLLGTLARLGADPDAPAPGDVTPRQVAAALSIPVKWP